MAGRGARGVYNTRSRSQTDIRSFGMSEGKSNQEEAAARDLERLNDESEKNNESNGMDELNDTIIDTVADVQQEEVGDKDGEKEGSAKSGKKSEKSVRKENGDGTSQQAEKSTDNKTTDGAGEKITGADLENLAEYILEGIKCENSRKSLEWELKVSNVLNDIVEASVIRDNMLVRKIEEIKEKCEKNIESCRDCKLYRENEKKIKEEMKAEKIRWEDEKIMLSERCLKAEKRVRELESEKISEREKNREKRDVNNRRNYYHNADYVTEEQTQELLRNPSLRKDEDRRERWSMVTSTPAGKNKEERNQREQGKNKEKEKEPRPLTECELREELRMRRNKKQIIRIKHKCRNNEEAIRIVEEKLDYKVDWGIVGRTEPGMVTLIFKNMEEKKNLILKKWKLKGTDIFIDDELTEREREVGKWLKELERREIAKGKMAKAGYMKLCINYTWMYWDEKKGLTDNPTRSG
ncbi:nucleoporin GLE1-like [Cotesia glomerata]|uniref:Uncharacterized protein n=1 Tax=Cotesia glomerata TaxID=32391 RepID=A0AAV7IZS7_COTGL|nr:nucleoporin GLE1-like [Cotesia glomerata]KAH0560978.1 hypothetical protein KQX54_010644 [Cotesia glomerata]